MTRQDIIDLSVDFVDVIPKDFLWKDDVFATISYPIDEAARKPGALQFKGYGIIDKVELIENDKNKRINVFCTNLTFFPPRQEVFIIQAPHLVLGKYQDYNRENEIRIIKLDKLHETLLEATKLFQFQEMLKNEIKDVIVNEEIQNEEVEELPKNILKFRKKNP
jgi:hypothetical protein